MNMPTGGVPLDFQRAKFYRSENIQKIPRGHVMGEELVIDSDASDVDSTPVCRFMRPMISSLLVPFGLLHQGEVLDDSNPPAVSHLVPVKSGCKDQIGLNLHKRTVACFPRDVLDARHRVSALLEQFDIYNGLGEGRRQLGFKMANELGFGFYSLGDALH